jgi:hypothetical protein
MSLWAAAPSGGSVDGRVSLGGDAAEVAPLGSRDVGGRPGPGWVRAAAYPQSDQAGQAGVRSAGGWRREGTGTGWRCEVAAPAA